MKPLPVLLIAGLVLASMTGCKTVTGISLSPIEGDRQFVLRNGSGHDLTGATLRGHIIWAGDVFSVPPTTVGAWPDGAELKTLNFHYPVSALVLHGFSKAGRFGVDWQESSRVIFDGRTIGSPTVRSVVDSTPMEVRLFSR